MKLIIYGEPMGKQRPRVCKGHAFTPAKTVNYETLVKETWASLEEKELMKGPLRARIIACYPIPKSLSNKQKERMVSGNIRPTKKPDLDNVAKIILDSLNQLAYEDDKQIVDLNITKWYSNQPRVEVIIAKMEGVYAV